MKIFNGFQLKIFMLVLMTLDHIVFIPELFSSTWQLIIHSASRCVSVWFAYMAVEGILYTKNCVKYNLRLFISALIMGIGNTILNFLFMKNGIYIYNNIFLTLSTGVFIINISRLQLKGIYKYLKILFIIVFVFLGLLLTEGGYVVIPFMLITYFFRNKEFVRNVLYLILSILVLIFSYVPYGSIKETILMLFYNSDWLFILVLPFIYFYNGERGKNSKFWKYFFYIYYPLHLWIIGFIRFLVN